MPDQTFGQLIAARRKELGHSYEAVARIIGTTVSTVSRLRRGVFLPERRWWPAWAHYLGLSEPEIAAVVERSQGDALGDLTAKVVGLMATTDELDRRLRAVERKAPRSPRPAR